MPTLQKVTDSLLKLNEFLGYMGRINGSMYLKCNIKPNFH